VNAATIIDRHVRKLEPIIISMDTTHRTRQIERLRASLERQLAAEGHITYVMPAFPQKSPNPNQVIDTDRADQAEYVALRTLTSLVDEHSYIIVATDGDVFLDLLRVSCNGQFMGFREEAAARFLRGLLEIVAELDRVFPGFSERLRFVSLGELLEMDSANARNFIRSEHERRAPTIKMCSHERFVYKGIRSTVDRCFGSLLCQMAEDAAEAVRHTLAFGVIVRSAIHGELISRKYPSAIRLSVHAQLGADKLGISLIPGTRVVPWNGVLVEKDDGTFAVVSREIVPEQEFTLVGEVLSENRSSRFLRARCLVERNVPSKCFCATSNSGAISFS